MSDTTVVSGNEQRSILPFVWDGLLILFIVLFAYLPCLNNGFVYDDQPYILTNKLVTQGGDLKTIFTTPYPPDRPEQGLYRPLVTLSYALDYKFWKGFALPESFNGFHFTNVVLHVLNVILFLILLDALGLGRWERLFAALIYALHPGLSEAVAWVVGRAELLSTFFGLLAILALVKKPKSMDIGLFLVFLLASMMSKESGVLFVFLAGLVLWFRCHRNQEKEVPWIPFAILSVITLGAFWWIRSRAIGSWHPSLVAYEGVVSTPLRILTALRVLWKYIALCFWPDPLSVYHNIAPTTDLAIGLLAGLGWFLIFWFSWQYRKSFPWFGLAFCWFWIAIFLVSNILLPIGAVYGERFAYTPFLFFAPLVIMLVGKILEQRFRDNKQILSVILMLVICGNFTALLWSRLPEWKNNISLWQSALRLYPNAFAVKAPLSEAYLFAGEFEQSRVLASEAIDQLQTQPAVYQKLFLAKLENIEAAAKSGIGQKIWLNRFIIANELAQNFRLREALLGYKELIQDFPEQPQTYDAIGDLYVRINNPVAAMQSFEEAIHLGLKNSLIYAKYGQVLSELGRKADAVIAYEQALKMNPKDFLTQYNYGVVLGELEDYTGALSAFTEANRLSPKFAAPRVNSAAILIHLQRYDEAKKEILTVLEADPKLKQDITREAKKMLLKIPRA
jgi:tetratricopeptide (TPR) repeat protein